MEFLVARANLSLALNPVFRRSPRSQTVLTARMDYALDEAWDFKEYVTGLEVSPTGRFSLLEGLRINSQSSDNLELATNEL